VTHHGQDPVWRDASSWVRAVEVVEGVALDVVHQDARTILMRDRPSILIVVRVQ
jgi:hypothetical protein